MERREINDNGQPWMADGRTGMKYYVGSKTPHDKTNSKLFLRAVNEIHRDIDKHAWGGVVYPARKYASKGEIVTRTKNVPKCLNV